MATGPLVAIMFHATFGFWGSETDTFVAAYKDLATCKQRIEQLDKEYGVRFGLHYFANHRYCQLVGVIQP